MGIHTCLFCGQPFKAKRGAITCSDKCRVALSSQRKRLKTHTVTALPPHAINKLEILGKHSPVAYERLLILIERDGAPKTEDTIIVAYQVLSDVLVENLFVR